MTVGRVRRGGPPITQSSEDFVRPLEPIRLGPFDLHEPLRAGGMGEVWSGIHRAQQVPVAIKVITAKQARNPRYHAAFGNEVRSVACLDHPAVVMVFDHGIVPEPVDRATAGRVAAGSPYLAMEFASGGSLKGVVPRSWRDLKATMLTLLDALAHAHARGVIHRDLKPSNILQCTALDWRPGLKLADFGVAHALDQDGHQRVDYGQGTPYYMAPEQCFGRWRDYGPWTDLYALGCVVYELVTGRPPFMGDTFTELALQHQHLIPPPIIQREWLPDGFYDWVLQLVQKAPDDRFQRAADAAWGLLSLPEPRTSLPGGGQAASPPRFEAGVRIPESLMGLSTLCQAMASAPLGDASTRSATMTVPETAEGLPLDLETWDPARFGEPPPMMDGASASAVTRAWPAPALPVHWRRPGVAERALPMKLVGAGLGLYGLRAVPLVGRERERDALWGALVETATKGRARCLLLRGAAGAGKSRLVEWLAERAHELGAASTVRALHSPMGGAADGVARMLSRHLRCFGLDRVTILGRVRAWLGGGRDEQSDAEGYAITELLAPPRTDELEEGSDEVASVRFDSPTERYSVVRRALERMAARRPVIAWIDDVQWGSDALGFVEHLLEVQELTPAPILVVMTARDDALAAIEDTRTRIEALEQQGALRALDVGPLDDTERGRLVRELLGLEGDLAAQVEERTGGNPLFAVQLVGDWVRRGVLEVGATGFVLRAGEHAELPDDLHSVWVGAVDRALADGGPDARRALELAACLGLSVDRQELEAACAQADLPVPSAALDQLLRARLAIAEPHGWTFAHGMLRDSLARGARASGEWVTANRLCAQVLEGLYPERSPELQERLGRHLVAAGDYEPALRPLLAGVRGRLEESDYRAARRLLADYDAAVGELEGAESRRELGAGWSARAWLNRLEGRYEEARAWGHRAVEQAAECADVAIEAAAMRTLGSVACLEGDLAAADEWLGRARAGYESLSDRVGTVGCMMELGWVAIEYSRDLERARTLFSDAIAEMEQLDDAVGVAEGLRALGQVALLRGTLDQAYELLARALEAHVAIGNRMGQATSLRALGMISRRRGEMGLALDYYRDAERLFEAIGNPVGVAACVNGEAEVARRQGDLEKAETGYRRALRIHGAAGSTASVFLRLNLGLVLLARRHFLEAREILDIAREQLEKSGRFGLLGSVHVQLATCATGRWTDWDHHLDEASRLLSESEMVDPDTARTARLAGDLACAAGEIGRGRRAYALALEQWQGLKSTDGVADLETLLAGIGVEPK